MAAAAAAALIYARPVSRSVGFITDSFLPSVFLSFLPFSDLALDLMAGISSPLPKEY